MFRSGVQSDAKTPSVKFPKSIPEIENFSSRLSFKQSVVRHSLMGYTYKKDKHSDVTSEGSGKKSVQPKT
ncbi:hypothetical protein TNCV_1744161 [Trichonephila clavipes]|nr:hypothetical protein TNCV_1744161 [Trichonephila clavipes]